MEEPSQSQVKWIMLRRRERRGQSRQSHRERSLPGPALPLGCCGGAPPPAGWLGWGFPGFCSSWNVPSSFLMWALYMLFPACSPSPPLLCTSHQAWLTLPHPLNIFLSQPRPSLQLQPSIHVRCRPSTDCREADPVWGAWRSHKSKAGNLGCPGLGESLSFL